MDLTAPRPLLPLFGDPSLFDKDWPDWPYHSVGSAMQLRTVLTWGAIDTILNGHSPQVPAFRMAHDNKLVPVQSITRSERATSQAVKGLADPVRVVTELSGGATLVLQGLQRLWPPLGDLCRRLAAEIGHPVFVNAYLTPHTEQGFGAHRDPYHAWLVQIEGSKTWRLWAPASDPSTEQPDREITLVAGDVLWIPRGWWHSGHSGKEPSLHLTFTVWATKTDDVLRAMLDELMHRNDFSQELPPNHLRDHEHAAMTVTAVLGEITTMMMELTSGAVQERLVDGQRERSVPLPARPIEAVLHDDRQLELHTHPEGVLHIGSDQSGVRLLTADTVLTVPAELVAPCQELLNRTGTFTLNEIEQSWPRGSRELLDQLQEARLICGAACRPGEA